MVDTSYKHFRHLHEVLESDPAELATLDDWTSLTLERRHDIIATLTGRLNGRRTVLYPNDRPDTQEVAW